MRATKGSPPGRSNKTSAGRVFGERGDMHADAFSRAAAVALGATGFLHLVIVGQYFEEAALLGVLFVAGASAAGFTTYRLWMSADRPAWLAGLGLCAGMGAGFVLSRTVGLFGFHDSSWTITGLIALVLEATFIAAYLVQHLKVQPPAREVYQR